MQTSDITWFLSVLTVLTQIFLGLVLVCWLLAKRIDLANAVVVKVAGYYLLLGFIFSGAAVVGSLYYSEIAGYEPCVLCWYQRIFMYPLLIIFGLAMYKKDKTVLPYVFVLSSMGLVLAIYHYYGQVFSTSSLPCSVLGYSVSCAQRFVMTFGYITIPMMSATAFAAVSLGSLIAMKVKK